MADGKKIFNAGSLKLPITLVVSPFSKGKQADLYKFDELNFAKDGGYSMGAEKNFKDGDKVTFVEKKKSPEGKTTFFLTSDGYAANSMDIEFDYKIPTDGTTQPTGGKPSDGKQLTDKQAGEVIGFFDALPAAIKRIQVLATLGVLGGGVIAYRRGSGIGGWLGWTFLGSLTGTLVAIGSVKFFPPKEGLISDSVKDAIKNSPPKTGNTGIAGGRDKGKHALPLEPTNVEEVAQVSETGVDGWQS